MPKEVVRRTVTALGNGAHVTVPKAWLGDEVVAVRVKDLVFMATNGHIADSGDPPAVVDSVGYRAYFENDLGEQMVFQADGKRATIRHGDAGWETMWHPTVVGPGEVMTGGIILRDEEKLFLRACAEAAQLPMSEPETDMERAVLKASRAKTKGEREKALREIGILIEAHAKRREAKDG